MKIISPITKNSNVTIVRHISSEYLISQWKELFGIDVAFDFKSNEEIYFCECNDSKMRFYFPLEIAGSDKLYKQLSEKFDWYYGEEKWEFDVGADIVKKILPKKVLEIGSGKGHFIKKILPFVKDTIGIEFNQDALAHAKKENLPITESTLSDLIKSSITFDFIASFEVFEHVINPLEFFEDSLELLNQNGRMLVAVPNRDSFIKYGEVLLDMPPHHMLSLNLDFFKYMSERYGLDLEMVKYEPLAVYHVDYFINLLKEGFYKKTKSKILRKLFQFCSKILKGMLSIGIIRSMINGQTILVVMRKK